MKIGAFAALMSPLHSAAQMAGLARSLEDAGMDSLRLGEHVMVFDEMEIVMMPGVDDGDSVRAFRDPGVDRLVPLVGTDDVANPAQRLRHLERLAALCA